MFRNTRTLVWFVVGALGSPLTTAAAELRVWAASSLTESLQEIAATYEGSGGEHILFNFGASSLLARQIQEGAPADLFFSADEAKMNSLDAQGLLAEGTRRDRLSNSLVIVVPTDSHLRISSPEDLTTSAVKRLALADPEAVPAGIYSRTFLEKKGLWAVLAPKVVPAASVRAAMAVVESGDVDAAMVYKTDATVSRKVKIACEIPGGTEPPIRYPMAVLKRARDPGAATRLLNYLDSAEAGRVFQRHGFIVLAHSNPTK